MPGIFASLPCDMTISSQNFPLIFPSKASRKNESRFCSQKMVDKYFPPKQYINCASGAQLGEHLPFLPLPCESCSIATDHHAIWLCNIATDRPCDGDTSHYSTILVSSTSMTFWICKPVFCLHNKFWFDSFWMHQFQQYVNAVGTVRTRNSRTFQIC